MTRAQARRSGHTLLEKVEWLDKKVSSRQQRDGRLLEDVLEDIRKIAFKLIDTPMREPK